MFDTGIAEAAQRIRDFITLVEWGSAMAIVAAALGIVLVIMAIYILAGQAEIKRKLNSLAPRPKPEPPYGAKPGVGWPNYESATTKTTSENT